MNHYIFEDMKIGMKASFEYVITDKNMREFASLSGDLNPMHVDADYARTKGYKDKIVYGMLVSSLYSTLVGMYLPGERCLLNRCDVNYRNPVYVGDKLNVIGEVTDKRNSTRRIKVKGKIVNQDRIIVNTSEITVSFTGE